VNPSIAAPRPAADPGWHLVQFYEQDAFLVDEVGKFFQAALLRGDAALLIATPEHRQAVASHQASKAGPGIGIDTVGEPAMFDAREMLGRFMVDGLPEEALFLASVGAAVRRASNGGKRRVAAFGEMVALLVEDGNTQGALRLEELWNELGSANPLSLMCAYPMRLFGGSEHVESFRHVCALHGVVRPVEGARPEPDADIASLTLAQLQQKTIALHNEIDRRVAAETAKDEFLAMLGHELRNPLAPIVTALQLMKMRGDIASSKEQAIIQRQVDHLIRLVDDLLDVSRITRGKVQLRKETVTIAQVVTKAVEMASMLFEQRGHHLAIDVPPIGLPWHGDATRLAQVIANLLTNAARYTEPGGNVWLRACKDGAEVVISVRDDGRGMEPELLAHAFDMFFQGQQGVDRSEGGLGIGLALVRNLVELHGGTVTARSEGRGKGCEFTVRLPANVAAEGNEPDSPLVAEPRPARAGEGRHVLIVDDNVDAADSLAALLQAHGHHVKVVYDPVAAIRLARGFTPDLALLDIGLPVMDGYELATQLRQMPALGAARFVALTGYGQSGDRERSIAAGFDHHFVKPVQVDELVRLVERVPASPR
jgi:signal transduction histidine kinase